MGLDVYLYRIDNYAKYKRLTEEYDAKSSAQWAALGEYNSLTEEQKDAARAEDLALAQSLGLEKWGEYPGQFRIKHNSRLYPEHMFKIGYLRSSYNGSGINRLLRDRLQTSLDDIFGAGEYEFQPDWHATRERAIKTLEDWRFLNASMSGKAYRVSEVGVNVFIPPAEYTTHSAADALKVFYDQLDTHKRRPSDCLSYGNRNGDFYLGEPLPVVGLIPGHRESFWGPPLPVVYVIYEAKDDDWYTQALEIVIENCEWVLEQPDKELYWLRWSN